MLEVKLETPKRLRDDPDALRRWEREDLGSAAREALAAALATSPNYPRDDTTTPVASLSRTTPATRRTS